MFTLLIWLVRASSYAFYYLYFTRACLASLVVYLLARPAVGNNICTFGVYIFSSLVGARVFDCRDIFLSLRVAPRLGGGTAILFIIAFLPEVLFLLCIYSDVRVSGLFVFLVESRAVVAVSCLSGVASLEGYEQGSSLQKRSFLFWSWNEIAFLCIMLGPAELVNFTKPR